MYAHYVETWYDCISYFLKTVTNHWVAAFSSLYGKYFPPIESGQRYLKNHNFVKVNYWGSIDQHFYIEPVFTYHTSYLLITVTNHWEYVYSALFFSTYKYGISLYVYINLVYVYTLCRNLVFLYILLAKHCNKSLSSCMKKPGIFMHTISLHTCENLAYLCTLCRNLIWSYILLLMVLYPSNIYIYILQMLIHNYQRVWFTLVFL